MVFRGNWLKRSLIMIGEMRHPHRVGPGRSRDFLRVEILAESGPVHDVMRRGTSHCWKKSSMEEIFQSGNNRPALVWRLPSPCRALRFRFPIGCFTASAALLFQREKPLLRVRGRPALVVHRPPSLGGRDNIGDQHFGRCYAYWAWSCQASRSCKSLAMPPERESVVLAHLGTCRVTDVIQPWTRLLKGRKAC